MRSSKDSRAPAEAKLVAGNMTDGVPIYPLVTTVAGSGRHGFVDGHMLKEAYLDTPLDLCLLSDSSILLADAKNNCLRRLDLQRETITTINTAGFLGPRSPILIDNGAAVVVSDSGHHKLRMLQFAEDGKIHDMTIAGTGRQGYYDGPADSALFNKPVGLCVISDGSILVVDCGNNCIRRVAARVGKPGLAVTTIAGTGIAGFRDGIHSHALLNQPTGITIDRHGTVLIADSGNSAIRALHPPSSGDFNARGWIMTTLCGGLTAGFSNGDTFQGQIREPTRFAVGLDGELIFSDSGNHCIRALCAGGGLGELAGLFSFKADVNHLAVETNAANTSHMPQATMEQQLQKAFSGAKRIVSLYVQARDEEGYDRRVHTVLASPTLFIDERTPLPKLSEIIKSEICGTATSYPDGSFEDSVVPGASTKLTIIPYEDVDRVLAAHSRYSRLLTIAGPDPATVEQAVAMHADETSRVHVPVVATAAGLASILKRGKAATAAEKLQKAIATFGKYADGAALTEARFRRPAGLCILPELAGSILVADSGNHFLRLLVSQKALDIAPPLLRALVSADAIVKGREAAVAIRLAYSAIQTNSVSEAESYPKDISSRAASPRSRKVIKSPSPVRSPTLSTGPSFFNRAVSPKTTSGSASPTSFGVAFGSTTPEPPRPRAHPTVSYSISTRRPADFPVNSPKRMQAVTVTAQPKQVLRGPPATANIPAKNRVSRAVAAKARSGNSWLADGFEGGPMETEQPAAFLPPQHTVTPSKPNSLMPVSISRSQTSERRSVSASRSRAHSVVSESLRRRQRDPLADGVFTGEAGLGTPLINGVPAVVRYSEELAASRHRATREIPDSRTMIAAEEAGAAADVVRALLLTDALRAGHAGMTAQGRVTTAPVGLLQARYTQHTASSAAALRAKGKTVVRGAPAFVNVANVVSQKLEDLRSRANAADEVAYNNRTQDDHSPILNDSPLLAKTKQVVMQSYTRPSTGRRPSTERRTSSSMRRASTESVVTAFEAIMSQPIAGVIREYHPSFTGSM